MHSITNEQFETVGAVDHWRTDSLVHGVILLLVLTGVQRVIGFFRAIFFCRWLSAEQLGLWDMAFGFLMLAGPLAVLGLPGAFGRYAEYYRLRGQLRPFLFRTALVCIVLALASVTLLGLTRAGFSNLIFGSIGHANLVLLMAVGLISVVAYNYSISVLTALRNMRMAVAMEFINGVLFAVFGVALLLTWQCNAAGVVVAYSGSCLAAFAAGSWWLFSAMKTVPYKIEPLPQRALWSKMIPFTAWILLINVLTNLFGIADRYMIIHFAAGSDEQTLAMVGDYHSSRVVPLLLISISSMMAAMLLPHLCHDWESGRRDLVSARLNFFLKLLAYGLIAASGAVLFIAPWLFGKAFQGKFAGGMAVLPWTLTYCVWFSLATVAQQYLWCAERAGLIGVSMAIGLAVNVGVNLLLLPHLGLLGVVLAVTVANLVALVLIICFAQLAGFRVHRGVWIVLAAAPALCLGPWITAVVLLAFALATSYGEQILSAEEEHHLLQVIKQFWDKLIKLRDKWAARN